MKTTDEINILAYEQAILAKENETDMGADVALQVNVRSLPTEIVAGNSSTTFGGTRTSQKTIRFTINPPFKHVRGGPFRPPGRRLENFAIRSRLNPALLDRLLYACVADLSVLDVIASAYDRQGVRILRTHILLGFHSKQSDESSCEATSNAAQP